MKDRATRERIGVGIVVAGIVAQGEERLAGSGQRIQGRCQRRDGSRAEAGGAGDGRRVGRKTVVQHAPWIARLGEEDAGRVATAEHQDQSRVRLQEAREPAKRGQLRLADYPRG